MVSVAHSPIEIAIQIPAGMPALEKILFVAEKLKIEAMKNGRSLTDYRYRCVFVRFLPEANTVIYRISKRW